MELYPHQKGRDIYITSNFAEYKYDNQNSKFYSNVIIKYDNKVITCDNLDLEIKQICNCTIMLKLKIQFCNESTVKIKYFNKRYRD